MSEAIMFVDDEENILNSLRRVFRKEPYELLACLSAEQALEMLESKQVQVLISDQLMPGMKGTELLKVVKEIYPSTIRIILSGHSEMEDIVRAINEGEVYCFLKKPEDLTDLVTVVSRAMEQSRLIQKVREMLIRLQGQSQTAKNYNFNTSHGNGVIRVELNGDMHILSPEQVSKICSVLLNSPDEAAELDIIGGVLARQYGKFTLVADLKSGFKLSFEMPIEKKNG
jgi:response regulator RpfG family c-di-GMP phosphodiesterase